MEGNAQLVKMDAPSDRIFGMPTISDDDAALAVKALEHYHAYLIAAKREDSAYQELAERLKRKPPEPEENNESGTVCSLSRNTASGVGGPTPCGDNYNRPC